MSRRPEQVASLIRRALQDVLSRGLDDPRVRGMVTITDVAITPDLREAHVRVSVLPAEGGELTLHALRHAAGRLRRELGDRVALRRVPMLRFELDEGLKRQAGVLEALARAARERGEQGEEQEQ